MRHRRVRRRRRRLRARTGWSAAVRLAEAGRRVLVVEAQPTPRRRAAHRGADPAGVPARRVRDGAAAGAGLAGVPRARPRPRRGRVRRTRRCRPRTRSTTARPPLVHRDVDATAAGFGARRPRRWRATVGADRRAPGSALVDTLLAPLDLPPHAPLAALPVTACSGRCPADRRPAPLFREPPARAAFAGMAAHSMLDLRSPVTAGVRAAARRAGALRRLAGGARRLAGAGRRAGRRGCAGTAASSSPGTGCATSTSCRRRRSVLLDLTPAPGAGGRRRPAAAPVPASARARYRYGPGRLQARLRAGRARARGATRPSAAPARSTSAARSRRSPPAEREVARGRAPGAARSCSACRPCVADPTRAPAGKHTFWAYCHVPNGSTVDMTAAIEAQIERFAPGFAGAGARPARDGARPRWRRTTPTRSAATSAAAPATCGSSSPARCSSLRPWRTPVPGRLPVLGEHAAGRRACTGWAAGQAAGLAAARGSSPGALPSRPGPLRRPQRTQCRRGEAPCR